MNLTEANFRRVAQLLSYEQSLAEIHDRLTADGMSEEDFFLCFAAGKRMFECAIACAHGVPMKFERHLSASFFRPDTERCAECRRSEDERSAREDAETDAFLGRLRNRKAQSA